MSQRDLDTVTEIENRSYEYPWTSGIFKDCLRVGYCCWVLHVEADVQAYAIMSVAVQEAHILNICVHKRFQRRGFGRALVNLLLDVAHRHRAQAVLLEVRPSNVAAIRLYRSLGFSEVGVRRQYYRGGAGREDALILEKKTEIGVTNNQRFGVTPLSDPGRQRSSFPG